MAFIPSVRLICHWLPPAFVPTMFSPLRCSPEATTQHPLRVIRWSDNAYITHYYAAAALIPERLRWNIARVGNCLPLDNSSYCSPGLPGVWSVFGIVEIVLCYNNAVLRKQQRIDLYRAAHGREYATSTLSTRRDISGGIGKHSPPPPDIRRRPMHSIEGALVWYGFRFHGLV